VQKLLLALCLCVSAVNLSCSSNPADLRAMMPADSLVYLESNDLGAVMKTITDRPAFREAAQTVPDFSALNGVKLAVSVTGFETKEEPVTEENSNLKFIPHFVAAIETNAWNFQANSFTENQLGEFVNHVYGGEVALESYNKNDGRYYEWKTNDGRKAFALVQGSVIFFSNDESSIDKCLAVKRGETDSIAKNPKITDGDRLAFGYVSPDGVAQIANIVSLALAKKVSDEEEVQGFTARALPVLFRTTIEELTWVATLSAEGIEDNYSVRLYPDIAKQLSSGLTAGAGDRSQLYEVIPSELTSITSYNLKNPSNAWKAVLSVVRRGIDPHTAKLVELIANSFFVEYGIENSEIFLASAESPILSVRLGERGERVAVIGTSFDERSLVEELRIGSTVQFEEGQVRTSKDESFAFGYRASPDFSIVGDKKAFEKCWYSYGSVRSENEVAIRTVIDRSEAAAVTVGFDRDTASEIANVLLAKPQKTSEPLSRYVAETTFDATGVRRRSVSDFGLIGWMITQFAADE
jgi:hypothetical protein